MELFAGPEIHAKVIQLIEGAKQELLLFTPYFKPWRQLSTILESAALARNVKVLSVLRGGEDRVRQEEAARPVKDKRNHPRQ